MPNVRISIVRNFVGILSGTGENRNWQRINSTMNPGPWLISYLDSHLEVETQEAGNSRSRRLQKLETPEDGVFEVLHRVQYKHLPSYQQDLGVRQGSWKRCVLRGSHKPPREASGCPRTGASVASITNHHQLMTCRYRRVAGSGLSVCQFPVTQVPTHLPI